MKCEPRKNTKGTKSTKDESFYHFTLSLEGEGKSEGENTGICHFDERSEEKSSLRTERFLAALEMTVYSFPLP